MGRKSADDGMLTRRRSAASLTLLPTDCLADETAAFDVLINADYAGHWVETSAGRSVVTWVGNGECIETESCGGKATKVIAAIRPTIPPSLLGPKEEPTPPAYDVAVVEELILEVAVELHPDHLPMGKLLQKVVTDPTDEKEIEAGVQAIANLKGVRLIQDREDEIVMPTPAGRRAVALFA